MTKLTCDADRAASHILKSATESGAILPQQLKQFNGFTIRALKKALRKEGVFKGKLTTTADRRLEKAFEAYVKRQASLQ